MKRASFVIAAVASFFPFASPASKSAESMQAVRYHEAGPSSVLRLEAAPRPVPKTGEVLVRVAAAGVNPIDVLIRQGWPAAGTPAYPVISGHDISGRVVAMGAGVDPALMDKDVFALISWRGGAYAEYVAVLAELVVPKPPRLTHVQAAAVPLAALTAYQALFVDGRLTAGQRILIHGGSGGVGHIAVQLAKHAGAHVLATASADNLEYVRSIGADVAIDYRKQRFEDVAGEVDFVLDTVGGDTLQRSYRMIRSGGTVVSIMESPDKALLAERKLQGVRTTVRPDRNNLRQIAVLIQKGVVTPTVSMTYPLAAAAVAQDDLSRLRKPGKSVLVIQELDEKSVASTH
jgi:NADPH:quinone reductase-like Zn-dependent oxidoreductase